MPSIVKIRSKISLMQVGVAVVLGSGCEFGDFGLDLKGTTTPALAI
jgi:hypothetical protein